MSYWQVGDLAVCVDASDRDGFGPDSAKVLSQGVVYTVVGITAPGDWLGSYRGVGLILAEVAQPHNSEGDFAADRFRKILPDKHEQCEPEFVTLLKRSKHKVPASADGRRMAETENTGSVPQGTTSAS